MSGVQALTAARNRRASGGIPSCPLLPIYSAGRMAALPSEGVAAELVTLVPVVRDQRLPELHRGSANVRIAQGEGNLEGNRRATGTEQRPKGTTGERRTMGKPEEGGQRGKNPAGKPGNWRKPVGEPEDVR
jgi:hypothetical protein